MKMIGYKDREVQNTKSKVYFNLHKEVFSVKQNGLVVLHTPALMLSNVTFQVSEAGRQQVLREKRKNVHAFVNGTFRGEYTGSAPRDWRQAYYNPYKTATFVDKETGVALLEAQDVILKDRQIWYR